jgi:hypothetical protein
MRDDAPRHLVDNRNEKYHDDHGRREGRFEHCVTGCASTEIMRSNRGEKVKKRESAALCTRLPVEAGFRNVCKSVLRGHDQKFL